MNGNNLLVMFSLLYGRANGLRYLRWGGDGEAVQPEKCSGVENCLRCAQNPQRQVHALLEGFVQDLLIESQNRHHKTEKIIARTLLFSKNQKLRAKIFARKLDQRTKIKFTKTFAEEISLVLKTCFSQT
jgi:hypothetical protein